MASCGKENERASEQGDTGEVSQAFTKVSLSSTIANHSLAVELIKIGGYNIIHIK